MNVRPYALLASSTVTAIGKRVESAVHEWCAGWGIDRSAVAVESRRAWDSAVPTAAEWRFLTSVEGERVWFSAGPALVEEVLSCMFAPDHRFRERGRVSAGSIASDSAQAAIDDLAARVASVFGTTPGYVSEAPAQPPEVLFVCGSGAVSISVGIGKSGCCVLADHAAVLTAVPLGGQPEGASVQWPRREDLLGGLPISLPVVLGSAEVEIGNLLTLAVGDVIRLDTLVDQPLPIVSPDGKALCAGYLHAMDRQVVIEIVQPEQ
jgi:hypothetical protein